MGTAIPPFPTAESATTLSAGTHTGLPRMFGAALAGRIEEEKLRPVSAGGHVVKAVQGTTRTCVYLVVNNDHFLCARRLWAGVVAAPNLAVAQNHRGYQRFLSKRRCKMAVSSYCFVYCTWIILAYSL